MTGEGEPLRSLRAVRKAKRGFTAENADPPGAEEGGEGDLPRIDADERGLSKLEVALLRMALALRQFLRLFSTLKEDP